MDVQISDSLTPTKWISKSRTLLAPGRKIFPQVFCACAYIPANSFPFLLPLAKQPRLLLFSLKTTVISI